MTNSNGGNSEFGHLLAYGGGGGEIKIAMVVMVDVVVEVEHLQIIQPHMTVVMIIQLVLETIDQMLIHLSQIYQCKDIEVDIVEVVFSAEVEVEGGGSGGDSSQKGVSGYNPGSSGAGGAGLEYSITGTSRILFCWWWCKWW